MAIAEILQTAVLIIVGLLMGGFLPFSLFYLFIYLRRHRFGWQTAGGLLLRILLIPVAFMFVIMLMGLLVELLGIELEPEGPPPPGAIYIGYAGGLGMLSGIVVFVSGVIAAIRARKHHADETRWRSG